MSDDEIGPIDHRIDPAKLEEALRAMRRREAMGLNEELFIDPEAQDQGTGRVFITITKPLQKGGGDPPADPNRGSPR